MIVEHTVFDSQRVSVNQLYLFHDNIISTLQVEKLSSTAETYIYLTQSNAVHQLTAILVQQYIILY